MLSESAGKVLVEIAKNYCDSIFLNTDAYNLSLRLFGEFPFPNLIPSRKNNGLTQQERILIDMAAEDWQKLLKNTDYGNKPFPDIHSLTFFLIVLSIGRKFLYRGQENSDWQLTTSLRRRLLEGWLESKIQKAKSDFIEKIHGLPDRRHLNLLEIENEALCQHYGFPTNFLDFTWNLNVAGFFALGGFNTYERGERPNEKYSKGSIWVIDVSGTPPTSIKIVTLGRSIMRPALQRGEFLKILGDISTTDVSIRKFEFYHKLKYWIDKLDNLSPISTMPMSAYLIPSRDPLANVADQIIEKLEKEMEEKWQQQK